VRKPMPRQLSIFSSEALLDPVNRQVVPGSREARKMTAGSGRKLSVCCKSASPLGACLRILLASETWGSTEYLLKWKGSATKSRRSIYRLVQSTRRNSGTDIGLSDTWPTPRKNENDQGNHEAIKQAGSSWLGQNRGSTVCTMLKATWATVTTQDQKTDNVCDQMYREAIANGEPVPTTAQRLRSTVKACWPTVDASDAGKTSRSGERKDEMLIGGLVRGTWPTPKSTESGPDYAIAGRENSGGISLPTAIGVPTSGCLARIPKFADRLTVLSCWLMGYSLEYIMNWEKKKSA
jgi:hypothetical protein